MNPSAPLNTPGTASLPQTPRCSTANCCKEDIAIFPPDDAAATDNYWRTHHAEQSYASEGDYELFAPAYRNGTDGYNRFGDTCTFSEVNQELREEYEAEGNDLPWETARLASRSAWNHLAQEEDADETNAESVYTSEGAAPRAERESVAA